MSRDPSPTRRPSAALGLTATLTSTCLLVASLTAPSHAHATGDHAQTDRATWSSTDAFRSATTDPSDPGDSDATDQWQVVGDLTCDYDDGSATTTSGSLENAIATSLPGTTATGYCYGYVSAPGSSPTDAGTADAGQPAAAPQTASSVIGQWNTQPHIRSAVAMNSPTDEQDIVAYVVVGVSVATVLSLMIWKSNLSDDVPLTPTTAEKYVEGARTGKALLVNTLSNYFAELMTDRAVMLNAIQVYNENSANKVQFQDIENAEILASVPLQLENIVFARPNGQPIPGSSPANWSNDSAKVVSDYLTLLQQSRQKLIATVSAPQPDGKSVMDHEIYKTVERTKIDKKTNKPYLKAAKVRETIADRVRANMQSSLTDGTSTLQIQRYDVGGEPIDGQYWSAGSYPLADKDLGVAFADDITNNKTGKRFADRSIKVASTDAVPNRAFRYYVTVGPDGHTLTTRVGVSPTAAQADLVDAANTLTFGQHLNPIADASLKSQWKNKGSLVFLKGVPAPKDQPTKSEALGVIDEEDFDACSNPASFRDEDLDLSGSIRQVDAAAACSDTDDDLDSALETGLNQAMGGQTSDALVLVTKQPGQDPQTTDLTDAVNKSLGSDESFGDVAADVLNGSRKPQTNGSGETQIVTQDVSEVIDSDISSSGTDPDLKPVFDQLKAYANFNDYDQVSMIKTVTRLWELQQGQGSTKTLADIANMVMNPGDDPVAQKVSQTVTQGVLPSDSSLVNPAEVARTLGFATNGPDGQQRALDAEQQLQVDQKVSENEDAAAEKTAKDANELIPDDA